MRRIPTLQNTVDLIVLLIIYAFLFNYFTPDLMLSATTTTGGDMGSHYVISQYLHDYLLPHGKLIGWYPHWMAGLPLLQFYFIPPYLLIVLLSYVIPMQIAFKLVTILGVLLLPLCAYAAFRLFGFEFPAPALAAAMTLPFLFMESYSFYGGNIKSTLAGQFPHGISFALTLLSIALVYYGMKRQKYLAANALLLSLAVLTHVYTTIVLAGTFVFFMAEAVLMRKRKEAKYLVILGIISFLLTAFWVVPLFAKFSFTAAPKDNFSGGFEEAIVEDFALFYLLGLVCVIIYPVLRSVFAMATGKKVEASLGSVMNMDARLSPLYYYIASSTLFYALNDHTILLRIRFLPQLYFLPLMFAAAGIFLLTKKLKANFLVPLITVLFITTWISTGIVGYFPTALQDDLEESPYLSHGVKDIPGWVKWNYEGLESKNKWETYRELTEYMSALDNSGRIDVEYSTDYNSYGTPRLFEASPVFTNRSVMEGLLLESSVTYPFLYYLNKEVSHDSWWPGFPIKTPKINLSQGAEDLWLYNVKYFVVSSDLIKGKIENETAYTHLKTIGEFEVYSLNPDSQFIEPATREPVLVVTDDWKTFSYQWMTSDQKDAPLVFSRDYGEYEREHFRIVVLDKQAAVAKTGDMEIYSPEQLDEALAASRVLEACTVSMESIAEEEFTAKTDCTGKPVLFKTSYFPNWMTDAAPKIYMASPSVMLFFPEKQDLRVYYGTTLPDMLGTLLTAAGLIVVAYLLLLNSRRFREKVHAPIAKAASESPASGAIRNAYARTAAFISCAYSLFMRKKYLLIIFAVALVAAYFLFAHLSESGKCADYCSARGYSSSSQSFYGFGDTVDEYDLGYTRTEANKEHNFVCKATCDPGRPDFVFISHGYVEFDMKVSPGVENILTLRVNDNHNCRSAALYLDDEFFRNVTGEGVYYWHDYEYEIPAEYISKDKVKVKLEYNNPDCYGWDLSYAAVKTPSCKCALS